MIDATLEAPKPVHRFTYENARENGRKGRLIRTLNERKAALAEAQQALTGPPASIEDQPLNELPYQQRRLQRVRKQLDRLDRMAFAEEDAQKLDRLASAQARLAEQERQLAGRPLPGSLKPSDRRTKPQQNQPQSGYSTEPTSAEPAPRIDDPNEPNG